MKCPDCKEIIKKYTPICAHCGISITTEEIGHYDLGHPTNWNLSAPGQGPIHYRQETLNGKVYGNRTTYHRNGQICSKFNIFYDKDKEQEIVIGPYVLYHENGEIEKQLFYDDNGSIQDGEYIEYYDNGSIRRKSSYKNGNIEGKDVRYFKDGSPRNFVHYKDGILHGDTIRYYHNGMIERKGNYLHGYKNGDWIGYYDMNGVLEFKGSYIPEKYSTEPIKDNYGNILHSQLLWIDGELVYHGRDGMKHGEWIYILNSDYDQRPRYEKGVFENGLKDGEWIEYDNDLTTIINRKKFNMGTLIK